MRWRVAIGFWQNPTSVTEHPFPRIAIAHDWLLHQRGGEKLLREFCLCLRDLSIYTLFLEARAIDPVISRHSVYVSPLGRWPGVGRYYRYLLPWFRYGIEHFCVRGADVLLSISHAVAKGIPHPAGLLHICYCLTPMRYLWCERKSYFPDARWSLQQRLLEMVSEGLQAWDLESNQGVNFFVAVSKTVQQRIRTVYSRDSEVIYPCVDLDLFKPMDLSRESFYLVVSSLVPYKRIDLAVEAFNRNGKPLLVVGEGPLRGRLERRARSNVRFLGWRTSQEIARLYCQAQALIFPGIEDFGLVPVEAQACGCPVIAYGQGGVTETVRAGETGLFFPQPTADALCRAVAEFEQTGLNRSQAVDNAQLFSSPRFRSEWSGYFAARGVGIKM